jgi:uncharacterized CHY-type Zn-finger protein
MKCPQCGEEQYCPCVNCSDWNAGKVVWRWIDGEAIACGHCGFTLHADGWLDVEATEYAAVTLNTNSKSP